MSSVRWFPWLSLLLLVACGGSGSDPCELASDCPMGERCVVGECVPAEDAGADGGSDGGSDAALDAFVPIGDASMGDADMADADMADAGDAGCTPTTSCTTAGFDCGSFVDDCGTSHDCGVCTDPETCGGAGTDNLCGCTPTTSCTTAGFECGSFVDDCGTSHDCGVCADPETCGGAGTDNLCGCTPTTSCTTAGFDCGSFVDDCGTSHDCGVCTDPETCGGAGTDNLCGCTPRTCEEAGADCGSIDDGCGAVIPCGSCGIPEICGLVTTNICDCFPSGPTAPRAAGGAINDASVGLNDWINLGSVRTANSSDADLIPSGSARVRLSTSTNKANYLITTGHGFALPDWVTVDGIEVRIRRSARNDTSQINDDEIRLVRGGALGAVNRSTGARWGSTFTTVTFGGPTDTWGETWTGADINAAGFGVAISPRWAGGAGNDDAFVDLVEIVVHVDARNVVTPWLPAGGGANVTVAGGVGTWSSTGMLGAVDSNDADFLPSGSARVRLSGGTTSSHYLVSNGHGAAVPMGETIQGIEMRVRRRSRDGGDIRERDIRLSRASGASFSAANRSTGAIWDATFRTLTYGGPTDLWGSAWTPDDVNASGFGMALRTEWRGSAGNDDSLVDYVELRVFHTASCP